jgi:hypothetical protein
MDTTLLTDDALQATFSDQMRDVTQEATNVLDIWAYVASVPANDLRGHQVHDQFVEHVYRDAEGRFDHVLVMTNTKNVYLAVVVDLVHNRVHGHYLLDLNEEYGLAAPGER